MSYFVFLTNSENLGFLHAYYTDLSHFPIKNRILSFSALTFLRGSPQSTPKPKADKLHLNVNLIQHQTPAKAYLAPNRRAYHRCTHTNQKVY
jgi:hypothetical protein